MTCNEANGCLLDDLAGRLDDGRRKARDEHVAACPACREAATTQADVARVLASRPPNEVRPYFAERLARQLAEQSGWFGVADWRWLSLRLAPIAALLLVFAGVTIERHAAEGPASTVSLSAVVETWASGESADAPVTSVLWQPQTSDDTALLTVLAAPSDATIVRTDR